MVTFREFISESMQDGIGTLVKNLIDTPCFTDANGMPVTQGKIYRYADADPFMVQYVMNHGVLVAIGYSPYGFRIYVEADFAHIGLQEAQVTQWQEQQIRGRAAGMSWRQEMLVENGVVPNMTVFALADRKLCKDTGHSVTMVERFLKDFPFDCGYPSIGVVKIGGRIAFVTVNGIVYTPGTMEERILALSEKLRETLPEVYGTCTEGGNVPFSNAYGNQITYVL